jgi:hypothetical protein
MATTQDGKTVLSAEEARQGKELGVMRYVLHISLALAVIAGVVIYTIFFH